MGLAVSLRTDFDGERLRLLVPRQRMPTRPGGCLRLHRSMTAVRAQMLPGWAV